MQYVTALQAMRNYFNRGATISYAFRKKQLQILRSVVLKYEKEIAAALYSDLKKSAEESYATETGLVIAEINNALKRLHTWMEPENVSSNLVNFPSTNKIYRDPLGVVLIIAPWNYPFQLILIPLVGAIAGGNCAVVKPSELAPATSMVLDKIIGEAFPAEYIRAFQGEGAELIPAMMKNFRFDHIFYTGSITVGRSIYQLAAADLVPVTLELGGKSPAIIEEDANLAVAARRIALSKFLNAGQTCVAPDYVLVQRNVKEKFLHLIKQAIDEFYSEDPSTSYDYSRIINEKRFDTILTYLDHAKIICGGKYNRQNLYISPTVIEDVKTETPVMTEEIFGPILPVLSFDGREEAYAILNRNPNPLAFYLFTNNSKVESEWIARLRFGGGCINNAVWQLGNHHLPFGGVGSSGMGGYHGKFSFETFTRPKPVMKTPGWFDPSIKYPPYKGKLRLFKWLIR